MMVCIPLVTTFLCARMLCDSGVIRKLRLGLSLRKQDDVWVIDTTKQRHKTSKFVSLGGLRTDMLHSHLLFHCSLLICLLFPISVSTVRAERHNRLGADRCLDRPLRF